MNYGTPIGTDNCNSAITVQTAGLRTGSTFPIGITTNTFEITDAGGKKATCSFTVTVKNPYCGNNKIEKKVFVCKKGNTMCVSVNALQALLNQGANLGPCDWYANNNSIHSTTEYAGIDFESNKLVPLSYSLTTYPNPFINDLKVNLVLSSKVKQVALVLYDANSRMVYQKVLGSNEVSRQVQTLDLSMAKALPPGSYLINFGESDIKTENAINNSFPYCKFLRVSVNVRRR